MKMINQMKLVFDSRSSNESFARTAITGFIASLDPTIEELTDIKTAISEAVTNCIVHAYGETINKIYISAIIYDNNFVVIKVKDKG
ncbi:MAG: anti-sigma F factor, partial [Oscillospiraceae bacterium]